MITCPSCKTELLFRNGHPVCPRHEIGDCVFDTIGCIGAKPHIRIEPELRHPPYSNVTYFSSPIQQHSR